MKKICIVLSLTVYLISCQNSEGSKIKDDSNSSSESDASESSLVKNGNGVKDIDGNTYKTVIIGDQEWMSSNLKTSKFSDGSAIPNETDDIEWEYIETAAWCHYNNDSKNNQVYGKLYNWFAVSHESNGNKNVCPSGWHVPSKDEWNILIEKLGGSMSETTAGSMKEVGNKNWKSPNTDATNSSLFTALPGGSRLGSGDGGGTNLGQFMDLGNYGSWWSSTESNADWSDDFCLSNETGYATMVTHTKDFGFSVRCLKD